jgi:hypothetical protein
MISKYIKMSLVFCEVHDEARAIDHCMCLPMVSMCVLCEVCSEVEKAVEHWPCNTPAEARSSTVIDEIKAWFAL